MSRGPKVAIDAAAATPPFEQLREALIAQIVSGELSAGTKLPPVRAFATEIGLAANTVARSYKELEAAGFVQTLGRNGTVVASRLDDASLQLRALELTREYVAAMTALGVPQAELGGYVDRV
jgi:GntR family transcriptional regulator